MPLLHRSLTSYDIRNHFLDCIIKTNGRRTIGSKFRNVFGRKRIACTGSSDKDAGIKQTDLRNYVVDSQYSSIVQMRRQRWSLSDYFEVRLKFSYLQ